MKNKENHQISRRGFLKSGLLGLGAAAISPALLSAQTKGSKLVILHTNDVHSQIEPIPANEKYGNMGGFSRRATLINDIRAKEATGLLLDAGDYFQGTPYFNFFKGEVEIKLMNRLKYDVATIGNHEFDNGVDMLYEQLKKAEFNIVSANYTFNEERWNDIVAPYSIVNKGDWRIGVIGIGIQPKGMIRDDNFTNIEFSDPLEVLNKTAELIHPHCDVIIGLTHVGIETDRMLAQKSKHVNIIIGGHSHTYLEAPEQYKNIEGKTVLVNQMGKRGAFLGRIDLFKEGEEVAADNTVALS